MVEPRFAARVLLLDPDDRLLLLRAQDDVVPYHWWVAPGGGLEAGESFEAAARRELFEETGLDLPIGRWVWVRRHVFEFRGATLDQRERYFLARTTSITIAPPKPDDYVTEWRWWTLAELIATHDVLTPRRLPELLADILAGRAPPEPIDCGV
ncbi:MAG: NUDIX domain-containing protein [Kofleriaceae bacterium]